MREGKVGLGVWLRDEIEDTLLAVDIANLDIADHIDTPEMRLYRKGYEAAIRSVAAAFGIAYPLLPSRTSTISGISEMRTVDI
jgi:hypothetical protein